MAANQTHDSAQASDLYRSIIDVLGTIYSAPIAIAHGDGTVAVMPGRALEVSRQHAEQRYGQGASERVVAIELEQGEYHEIPTDGLLLWRQHGQAHDAGEVVTELIDGDPPIQIVTRVDDWHLVRTLDGATGWLTPDQWRSSFAAGSLRCPEDFSHAPSVDEQPVDRQSFAAHAEAFTGTPYIWGGTSTDGIDCSGLVQRAAWQASRIWLPRHSRALLKVGSRVSPRKVERGDILVLQRDMSQVEPERLAVANAQAQREVETGAVSPSGPAIHPMHVAVAISTADAVHASRDQMSVVTEPIVSIRERYRVLGVRRLDGAGK